MGGLEQTPKIIQGRGSGGMILAKGLLLNRQRPAEQRFCSPVVVLLAKRQPEVVEQNRDTRVVFAGRFLLLLESEPIIRLGVGWIQRRQNGQASRGDTRFRTLRRRSKQIVRLLAFFRSWLCLGK